MGFYVAKRLTLLIPTMLGVVTLVFFFIHMIPGDPVEVMLGETAQAVDKEKLRDNLGLNEPIPKQYVSFLGGLIKGNLGESFFFHEPVMKVIKERLPATIRLALAAMGVAICFAIPAGVVAAARQYSVFDSTAMFLAMLGVAMPHFWLGPLLIWIFAIKLPFFPVSGNVEPFAIVLPAITLGSGLAAMLSRMTRSAVLEVLRQDFVSAARAKGIPEWKVMTKHVLRPALIPILTVIGLQFGAVLSGAIITETVFAWPGMGTLFVDAIQARDYPMVQGCVLMISFIYVITNLVTDLAYAAVDPRVRYGKA